MKVLSACAEAGVKHVVLKSSTLVYGAQTRQLRFFARGYPSLNAKRNFGTLRDLLEIENFIATFRGQSPEVKLTLLRFANILGPDCRIAAHTILGATTPRPCCWDSIPWCR